jgi:hypothetical protein
MCEGNGECLTECNCRYLKGTTELYGYYTTQTIIYPYPTLKTKSYNTKYKFKY